MPDRKTITDLYVRTCRDSGYRFDYLRATHFVADLLRVSAIEVWCAMGSFDVMQRVADGSHPACGRQAPARARSAEGEDDADYTSDPCNFPENIR